MSAEFDHAQHRHWIKAMYQAGFVKLCLRLDLAALGIAGPLRQVTVDATNGDAGWVIDRSGALWRVLDMRRQPVARRVLFAPAARFRFSQRPNWMREDGRV